MAAASKSSQKAKNVVIALLAVWSIISLIVIVVWATSPDLKGVAHCQADLREKTALLEGERVVWQKNKVALEEQVEEEREKIARQGAQILLLLGRLNATNASLEMCRQETEALSRNISVLQENVEQLHQTKANLTAQLGLKEDEIEALEQNVTQNVHQTMSCLNLKAAADSQMIAAQSQTKACESEKQYLQKQLQKCKDVESEAPKQSQQQDTTTPKPPGSGAAPLAGIPALTLLVCIALHLITCERRRHTANHSHMTEFGHTPACRPTASTVVQEGAEPGRT